MNRIGAFSSVGEKSARRERAFRFDDGSMVFIPLLFYAFFCQSFAVSRIVLGLCLLISISALFLHFLANRRFATKKFGLEVAWVPFFVLYFVHSFIYGVSNAYVFAMYALLFVYMYATSGERRWVASCVKVLVAFSVFHAVCTIVFWLMPSLYSPVKSAFFSSSYMARDYRSGFTAHYSTNSIYLSLGLTCWICGLVGCRRRLRGEDILIGSLLMLALLLTTKRGPLIATVVAISLCYLCANREKITGTALKATVVVLVAAVSVSILAALVPSVQATLERFAELFVDETGNGRSELYDCAWDMYHASPLLGNGWGSYGKYVSTTSLGAMYEEIGFTSMSAHNVYLQLLAETGILGLVLFAAPAFATLLFAIRRSRAHDDPMPYGDSFCLWACLGIQIFFLVYCLSGNPLYDPQCYVPYFISITVVLAICGPGCKQGRARDGESS